MPCSHGITQAWKGSTVLSGFCSNHLFGLQHTKNVDPGVLLAVVNLRLQLLFGPIFPVLTFLLAEALDRFASHFINHSFL